MDRAAIWRGSGHPRRGAVSRWRDEDPAHAACGSQRAARRRASGGRARGRRRAVDRSRTSRRPARGPRRLRLGGRHERHRRAGAPPSRARGKRAASLRSEPPRRLRSGTPTWFQPSRPRRVCSPSSRALRDACSSPARKRLGGSSWTSCGPISSRSTGPSSSARSRLRGGRGRPRFSVSRASPRGARPRDPRGHDRARDHEAAEEHGIRVVREARPTTSTACRGVSVRADRVVITFLSDFGLADDFVGTCHGVIKRIAPEAEIIDITHGIRPQQHPAGRARAREHAAVHARGRPPRGGRPGRRQLRGGRSPSAPATGGCYVGPDNGLLIPAAERLGGVEEAHEIANRRLCTRAGFPHVPRARHLLTGRCTSVARPRPAELGRPIDAADARAARRFRSPRSASGGSAPRALRRPLRQHPAQPRSARRSRGRGHRPGREGRARVAIERYYALAARTFADARTGDIILYEDAYGNIAIAISARQRRRRCSACAGTGIGGERYESEPGVAVGRRFARLATDAVVRWPRLWPRLPSADRAGSSTAWRRDWDAMRRPDTLAPYEAALERASSPPGRALDLGTGTGAGALRDRASVFPRPRSSGSTSPTAMLERGPRKTPPELAESRALRGRPTLPTSLSPTRRSTSSRTRT